MHQPIPLCAVLAVLSALPAPQIARAQTEPDTCKACPAANVSNDDFREMQGLKVYPKIIVDDVTFDGPDRLPAGVDEAEVISDLKRHVLERGQDGLDEVMEIRIRGAWEDQGFFKVLAKGDMRFVSSDDELKHAVITVHVDKGLQYRLGDLRFRASNSDYRDALAFPVGTLRQFIPLKERDIFSVTKIRDSLDSLKKWYGSHGYIEFVASPLTDVNDATRRINLMMELSEGKQFRIGKVEVSGLSARKTTTLIAALQPGSVFDARFVNELVRKNLQGLSKARASEIPALRKNEKDGTVDIVIKVPPRGL